MNLLVLDTEKTYNIGVVIIDDKQVLEEKEFVVKENFNDPLICGEANRKRKTKQFDEAKHQIEYTNAADCINQISYLIKKYKIQYILGHNVSEDRIQFGNLLKQAEPYLAQDTVDDFKSMQYFDTQKVVKALLPNNRTINLKDTVEDLTGLSFSQSHTALADAQLLSKILLVCGKFLPLFLNNIDMKDRKILGALSFPSSSYVSSKRIFEGFSNKIDFTIKGFNTQCDKFVEEGLLYFNEIPQYSEKTGKLLRTTLRGYKLTSRGVELYNLLKDFEKNDWVTKLTEAFQQHVAENDSSVDEIRMIFEETYQRKQHELEQQYQEKQKQLEKQYQEKQKQLECTKEKLTQEREEGQKIIEAAKLDYEQNLKDYKKITLAWHIICPILGVVLGVLAFILLQVRG